MFQTLNTKAKALDSIQSLREEFGYKNSLQAIIQILRPIYEADLKDGIVDEAIFVPFVSALLKSNEFGVAEEIISQAELIEPNEFFILQQRVNLFLKTERFDEAEVLLNEFNADRDNQDNVLSLRTSFAKAKKNFEEAFFILMDAYQLNKHRNETFFCDLLGTMALLKKSPLEKLPIAMQALEIHASATKVLEEVAHVFIQAANVLRYDDPASAQSLRKDALAALLKLPESHIKKQNLSFKIDRLKDAIDNPQKYAPIAKTPLFSLDVLTSDEYERIKKSARVIAHAENFGAAHRFIQREFEKAGEQHPMLAAQAARYALINRDYEDVEKFLAMAEGKTSDAWNFDMLTIGLYAQTNREEEAFQKSAEAHKKYPQDTQAAFVYGLGLASKQMGMEFVMALKPYVDKAISGEIALTAGIELIALWAAMLPSEEAREKVILRTTTKQQDIDKLFSKVEKYRESLAEDKYANVVYPTRWEEKLVRAYGASRIWDLTTEARGVDRVAQRVAHNLNPNYH